MAFEILFQILAVSMIFPGNLVGMRKRVCLVIFALKRSKAKVPYQIILVSIKDLLHAPFVKKYLQQFQV